MHVVNYNNFIMYIVVIALANDADIMNFFYRFHYRYRMKNYRKYHDIV